MALALKLDDQLAELLLGDPLVGHMQREPLLPRPFVQTHPGRPETGFHAVA
ncbi:MAG TPA: hypothetical protein PLF88_08170 [Opitutaceae bacterium]|nr:hypothetical protein [Opitutaceae bacterium]HRJ47994.1 hypothetical protein [Opitutaceae bacterium]